ncbi:terminase B [Pseudomonas phage Misse]|uniref:Terminase B n=1 Tax=Pseudomonas phage Bertil TaxID=2801385 RepID=A0A7T8IW44_9CAUD|nr:terminase B [Pseudomonas phage Bertil]QQO90861.1 terminase B [Pseudomonas phage Misse]QQO90912.1 terminase B [Pseudomonas phage Strit]
MDQKLRFAHAAAVADTYLHFVDFAIDGMAFLGFPLTDMQADIAEFMEYGPRLRMVMAQRGEAKSTLAALYAVWRIIQRCTTRVLIVSAGELQASEVATLVVRLITTWDILEYLRPDRQAGDRCSVMAFDVHYTLKGIDKSPSVACVGITANLPGKRADLLIPDDIESPKNAMTSTERNKLKHLSKEFSSICTHGDILYLGTPQTKDSIYNSLPGRGFAVRIWPGRFPTPEEAVKYGDRLAPFLAERILQDPRLQTGGGLDGTRGQPADPDRFTEDDLIEKELDKGPEDFSLQHMLDTSLNDAARQQLKLSDLMVANFDAESVPEILPYRADPRLQVALDFGTFPVPMTVMYHPASTDCAFVTPQLRMMYIDPAGGGADEMGYGVSTAVGSYIHSLDVGGIKGGLTEANGILLCELMKLYGVTVVQVESNMGHGLFEINLRALLDKLKIGFTAESGVVYPPDPFYGTVGVIGEYSTGQKEKRIIDSVVSAMQRHRVILHQAVFASDIKWGMQHGADKRANYSLFQQISSITTDRNSLAHDDRIEAWAGSVRYWKGVLAVDEHKAAAARKEADARAFVDNPMGYDDAPKRLKGTRNSIQRRRR